MLTVFPQAAGALSTELSSQRQRSASPSSVPCSGISNKGSSSSSSSSNSKSNQCCSSNKGCSNSRCSRGSSCLGGMPSSCRRVVLQSASGTPTSKMMEALLAGEMRERWRKMAYRWEQL